MPRPHASYPAYRLHRPSGQAVVTIAGCDHYLGPHNSVESRAAYDRVVLEWVAAGRPSIPLQRRNDLSIAELCLLFWEHAEQRYQRVGQPTGELPPYRSVIRLVRQLYGTLPAREFGADQLRTIRAKMIELSWCRRTINRQVLRIRHVFRWGYSQKLVDIAIYQELQMVDGLRHAEFGAKEKTEVVAVSDADIERTLPCLTSVVADMVRLQLRTGARPGEICQLRPQDIDTLQDIWLFRPQYHKTQHRGRTRVICLGAEAQRILRPYLSGCDDDSYCFRPEAAVEEHLRVVRSSAKNPQRKPRKQRSSKPRAYQPVYTPNTYRRAIHRACDRAKIERWSPNQLRHAAARRARQHFAIDGAQAMLGHASVRMAEHYAQLELAKAMEVARQLG